MTATLDARDYATAVKAAIKAQLGAINVYEYGQVPGADGVAGTMPDNFVIVTVGRRAGGTRRASAKVGTSGWRVTARSVGKSVDNTRLTMLKVTTALNEVRLTVDGRLTTPIQFESEQTPGPDSGRFSALSAWTFAV